MPRGGGGGGGGRGGAGRGGRGWRPYPWRGGYPGGALYGPLIVYEDIALLETDPNEVVAAKLHGDPNDCHEW